MIRVPTGLEISGPTPVDSRLVLTKAQMLGQSSFLMPSVYLAVCKDDGKLYLYNESNTSLPTTGKYRPVLEDIEADLSDIQDQIVEINEELANKQDVLTAGDGIDISMVDGHLTISSTISVETLSDQLPAALREALANQDNSASGLMVDADGNIKVSLDSDYLSIDENNNITFADDLIISGN